MSRRFYSNPVRLAITLGDPAGIGPEVALKALARHRRSDHEEILLIGRADFYTSLSRRLRLPLNFFDLNDARQRPAPRDRALACFFPGQFPKKMILGRSVVPQTRLAVRSIETAVALAMEGMVDAVVTSPIHKAGLQKAGYSMPGHTEYLAQLAGSPRVEMMLVGGPLRVVLVTRHLALRKVPGQVTPKRLTQTLETTIKELKQSFGIARPRLGICGLNPHAGEEGTLGTEESKFIRPVVDQLRRRFPDVKMDGPLSPDALFVEAYRGRWDAQICMYHDQGLIPLKMISRGAGVNVTLGLPFVRTSPDHGTAYDIASKMTADPGSFGEALELAIHLVRHRRQYGRPGR